MTEQNSFNKPLLIFRSTLWWLVFIISTALFIIPVLIACLISYHKGFATIRMWLCTNLFALEKLCKLTCEVEGIEHLKGGPHMILSKHQSTWETLYLPYVIRDPIFVAKRELVVIPAFGWGLYMADTILIKRGTGRSAIKQIQEQAEERFSRGRNLVIFPEGTRRAPDDEPEYKIGGAAVASKLGVPVVPVAHNAGEFWPRHSFVKWPGVISVRVGEPIASEGKSADQIQGEVVEWIESTQKGITQLDRFPY